MDDAANAKFPRSEVTSVFATKRKCRLFLVTKARPARQPGMLTLLRNGGYPWMLFILLTGLIGLGTAFHFALRARRENLGFIRDMALATVFGTLAASCGDFGATLYAAEKAFEKTEANEKQPARSGREDETATQALHMVVEGSAESTSPGILGFSLLAVTSMLVAVGRRRLDERERVRAGSNAA
jgi:hypothetical protein